MKKEGRLLPPSFFYLSYILQYVVIYIPRIALCNQYANIPAI